MGIFRRFLFLLNKPLRHAEETARDDAPPAAQTETPSSEPLNQAFDTLFERLRRIIRVGHTKPAPTFGAPALVWHLGLWPREDYDPLRSLTPRDQEQLFNSMSESERQEFLPTLRNKEHTGEGGAKNSIFRPASG